MADVKKPAVPRAYEKGLQPVKPAPAPTPQYAVGLVASSHMGQPRHQVVVYVVTGMECVPHLLPDGSHERMEQALADVRAVCTQVFRFKNVDAVIAGDI